MNIKIGKWLVEPENHRILFETKVVSIKPQTMQLLLVLAEANGAVVSKDDLKNKLWKGESVADETLVQMIVQLRKAFDSLPGSSDTIETVRGEGFRLTQAVEKYEAVKPQTLVLEKGSPFKTIMWLFALTALVAAIIFSLTISIRT